MDDIISHIYDLIDEIIIVDGPYKYSVPTFKTINLYYDTHNKPNELSHIIQKYSCKIKYHYKIWIDEKEKQIFGYS